MRARWLLLAVAGCYHPTPPAGDPCTTAGECPDGLTCGADGLCEQGGGGTPDAPSGTDGGDGGAIDGPPADPLLVHATVGYVVVAPDGTLTNLLDSSVVDVALADGTAPTLTDLPDGSVTFERASPTQGYSVVVYDMEIDGTTPSLTYLAPIYGRPNLEHPDKESDIDVTLAHGNLSGGTTTLFATGQRAELDQSDDPFSFQVDWEDSYGYTADSGLLDASQGDTLWFLHYADDSGGAAWIDAAVGSAVTQADGQTVSVSATLVTQTLECARLQGSITEDATRLNGIVNDGDTVDPYMVMGSQPAAAHVVGSEFGLGWGPVGDDSTIDLQYSEPFPNEDVVAFVDQELDVTHLCGTGSNAPTTAFNAETISEVILAPGAHACNAASVITVPQAPNIPTSFTIADKSLTADLQQINASGLSNITISFTVDAGGGADVYSIQVYDVTNGDTDYQGTIISTVPAFSIPKSAFTHGDLYQIEASVATGFPHAADGDLSTLVRPYTVAWMPSATFAIK